MEVLHKISGVCLEFIRCEWFFYEINNLKKQSQKNVNKKDGVPIINIFN